MNPLVGYGSLLHSELAWERFRERMTSQAASRTSLSDAVEPWLTASPPTIVTKMHPVPSESPHDYVSIAPYSWPDPARPDGLPWITRDGEVNPVFYDYDNPTLERFCQAVTQLALFAEATGSIPHAECAGRFLQAWFLDGNTQMNPHLRHAQFVPGANDGRPTGIIDTTSLLFVFDAATRLPFGREWTPDHLAGVKGWGSKYLDWLLESAFGRIEAAEGNNHGTWYDAQVTGFALFCDRLDVARRQIEASTVGRLETQIEADGSQPRELGRTLSLTYCTYNLLGFACVAQVAKRFDLDLWNLTTGDGTSLAHALHWMMPYYAGTKPWTHRQVKPFDLSCAALLLNLGWQGTGDPELFSLMQKIAKRPWQEMTFSKASLTGRRPPPPPFSTRTNDAIISS